MAESDQNLEAPGSAEPDGAGGTDSPAADNHAAAVVLAAVSPNGAPQPGPDSSGPGPAATKPMSRGGRTAIGIWIITLSAVALGHLPWAWSLAERLSGTQRGVRARWLGYAF